MKNNSLRYCLAALLFAPFVGLKAQTVVTTEPAIKYTAGTGFDYSKGDYGFTQDTEVFSVPLNLSLDTGTWLVRASFSYLNIDGPASVVAGGGAGTARPTTRSESGFGDILLGATYRLPAFSNGWHLDLTARTKFGTADEDKGLGTGEQDYYFEATTYKTFGAWTPLLTVGYRVLGDSDLYQLENGVYGTGGVSYKVSDATIVGALVSWREKVVKGSDDATELTVFATHNLTDQWQLLGYALKGFTDGSPDFGVGGQINYRF